MSGEQIAAKANNSTINTQSIKSKTYEQCNRRDSKKRKRMVQ